MGKKASIDRAKATCKAKAKAKSKSKAKAKARPMKRKNERKQREPEPDKENMIPRRDGDPAVPRSNIRAQTISGGPAKGWRVVVWLRDVSENKQAETSKHGLAVRWRISSPRRTRSFGSFGAVQKEEGDGIHAQMYTAVRPGLLRGITNRRLFLEGCTPQSTAKDRMPAKTPAVRTRLPGVDQWAQMATQKFEDKQCKDIVIAPSKASWSMCACDAHLRRHPRCSAGGSPVVHMSDHMVVGRGESCDLVLNSTRTPQMISRCHAVVHKEEGVYSLVDQGSLNGIMVNGSKVEGRRSLQDGDTVTFGVASPQPEFDYIFESRPWGLARKGDSLLATQLFQERHLP